MSQRLRRLVVPILLPLGTLMPASAPAALGGKYRSVQADGVHLSARMESSAAAASTVHVLTTPNGGTVREYVGADGNVFALSWRGPGRPDLRQLLGDRFTAFQSVRRPHPGASRGRTPVSVRAGDMVVRVAGHPGAFWGVAYLPGAVPAGFTLDDQR